MTRLRAGAATSTGRVRSINQDSHLLAPEHDLFVVADGIGGNQGGEVASQMAVDIVAELATEGTAENLLEAVTIANRRIFERAGSDPLLHGMGTTLVAVQALAPPTPTDASPLTDEGGDAAPPEGSADDPATELCWINVGDSRVYLLRDGEILQLSEDHSLVEELVRGGAISEEEARVHPQRNIITRSLGVDTEVRADLGTIVPYRGDRLLLCSDGLTNEVGDDQIAAVLRRLADPDEAAAELVRLANEAGGRDNITVAIVDVTDDGGRSLTASEALSDEPLTSGSLPGARTMRIDEDGTTVEETPDIPADGATEPNPPDVDELTHPVEPVKPRRFTWRVFAFLFLLVLIAAATIGGIGWTARNTWFVRYDGTDHVALYRGKPGGVLFFDPELVETSDLGRGDVAALYQPDLEAGKEFRSQAAASRYLQNLLHARTATIGTGGTTDDPGPETTTTERSTGSTSAETSTPEAATTTSEVSTTTTPTTTTRP